MPVARRVPCFLFAVFVLFGVGAANAQSTFETQGETFEITAAGLFTSDVSVLANDSVNPTDSLVAELVSPPSQGTLTFRADGTFDYDPAGASGMQVFTYRAGTLPTQRLDLVPEESVLLFEAELQPEALAGASHDSESVVFTGTVHVDVGPAAMLGDQIHILGLTVQNRDDIGLVFDYGALGAFNIDTVPGGLRLALEEVGASAVLQGEPPAFNQSNNALSLEVDAHVSGEGFIGGQVQEGTENLATTFGFDLSGTAEMSSSLTLDIAFETYNEFDLEGDSIRVSTTGTLRATGVPVDRLYSDPVEVVLNVAGATDMEDNELPGVSRLTAVYPNPARQEATLLLSDRPLQPRMAEVVDVLGRTVRTVSVSDMRATVDVTGLAAGVYLVRLSDARWSSLTLIVR